MTGIDEGYVKYASEWTPGEPPDSRYVDVLRRWRRPLHDAGLVGHYAEHDVGYGNISIRAGEHGQFVISGTQTGHIADTLAEHYALVTEADVAANRVCSTGPLAPSSEAMTHAALYALSDAIGAVVHVHDGELWRSNKGLIPTTDAAVAYGTPAMAAEFERLWHATDFGQVGLAVMAGHDEGLLSIGRDLEEAATRILALKSQP
jgi:ribulose-5-phosphate 4-epimerase/fuculose-1-phosphate aldolase